jgi:hypothetical protein
MLVGTTKYFLLTINRDTKSVEHHRNQVYLLFSGLDRKMSDNLQVQLAHFFSTLADKLRHPAVEGDSPARIFVSCTVRIFFPPLVIRKARLTAFQLSTNNRYMAT